MHSPSGSGIAARVGNTQKVGGEINAGVETSSVTDYAGTVKDVFGMDWAELKSVADISTTKPDGVPSPFSDFALIVLEGNAVFDIKRPLRGTGIVVVKGDVHIQPGSNSFFDGVLYVEGNVVVEAPAYLRGTIIATGGVALRGNADYVDVHHDPGTVSLALTVTGQYRFSRATYDPALFGSSTRAAP